MARYYTVCTATPSLKTGRTNYEIIYPQASEGYLFHDTENELNFSDIQKALWMLSDIHEGGSTVVASRVNATTIMATFSGSSFPRPRLVVVNAYSSKRREYEYLAQSQLQGWVLENIKDPGAEATPVVFDEVYDECTRLERFAGHCPCSALAEGECLPQTLFQKFPYLAGNMTNYTAVDTTTYHRKRYENINGFEYISGVYATSAEFEKAVRPWDNYDFALVPKRKLELESRASENSRRHGHRREVCSQCVFSIKMHTGTFKDCGQISSCENSATEETAWTALFKWLDTSTDFTRGTEDFPLKAIRYLIRYSGAEYRSRAITPTRTGDVKLAGFILSTYEELKYSVVPVKGALQRYRNFTSYQALREAIPELPHLEAIPEIELHEKDVLAHAVLGTTRTIRCASHQPHPRYSVSYIGGSAVLEGCTSRSVFSSKALCPGTSVVDFYTWLWPGSQPKANDFVRQTAVYPDCRKY